MTKKKKTAIKIAVVVLAVLLVGFFILYDNGLSGIHHHTNAKEGQIKIACVGDSITYGHGIGGWAKNNYPAQLQVILGDNYHVQNFGESGRTLSSKGDKPYVESKQYQLSLEYDADIIIFMLGTNDSKPENWTGAIDFISEYDAILESYKENNPDVRIILCTPAKAFFDGNKTEGTTNFDIQPSVVNEIRNSIRAYGLANGYEVIDVYDLTQYHEEWFDADNVHPSRDGARAIAELVAKKVIN